MRTPEELAGVLAHEIQHVLLRHGTRALLQYFSTHPDTAGRITALRDRAARTPFRPVAIVPDYDWRKTGTACRSGGE